MLRSLDDEVRANTAHAISQYVQDNAKADEQGDVEVAAAEIFETAAAPFLSQVWPQERSLTTPGVSKAFSRLPATAGRVFDKVVDAVERFLAPCDCWSMVDYGLHGRTGEEPKLKMIDTEAKGRALLKLPDLTVGTSEGAVVPRNLTDALSRIREVAQSVTGTPAYRRLSTVARR